MRLQKAIGSGDLPPYRPCGAGNGNRSFPSSATRRRYAGSLHDQDACKHAHAAAQDHQNRGHFPNDEAASKLLYLALRKIDKDWKMLPITSKQAASQFAILFGERFTDAIG